MKHHSRLLATVLALAAVATFASAATAGASARAHGVSRTAPVLRMSHPAPAGMKPRTVGTVPLRVPDPRAYAAQKAAANAAAARQAARPVSGTSRKAPTIVRSWAGQRDMAVAPSDSTGAIGTTRYIELINAKGAVYNRTSNTPTASAPLLQLTGCASATCSDDVFDPQVIWDPGTKRFYYAADDVVSSTQHFLAFGFSTTATPTLSNASWCRYNLSFGSTFPDYPKLGDTKDFALFGTNNFSGNTFTGSSIAWVTKPPAGTACPAPSSFMAGVSATLKNANGTNAFTPVPGNQIDTGSMGWAVARPASIPSGGATFLTVFKVTKSATGAATIPATGSSVPVSAYSVPASAHQSGTSDTLDTLDARNTQAVLAIDPAHGGAAALWTQHAVRGGAGSQVRWYEINPATHTLIQNGTISSLSSFIFDGAVSPDRRVNGSSKLFGGDMVIDVVQSSASTLPAVEVASKIGSGAISSLTTIATSAAADTGFDCIQGNGLCRWGDYAGASPDPAAPTTAAVGQVWGSSMLGAPGGSASSSGWTTRNFAIKP
jgi:hypothetical protein